MQIQSLKRVTKNIGGNGNSFSADIFCIYSPEDVADLGEDVVGGEEFLAVVDEEDVGRGVFDDVFLVAVGFTYAALEEVALHRPLEHFLRNGDHYPCEVLAVFRAAEAERALDAIMPLGQEL